MHLSASTPDGKDAERAPLLHERVKPAGACQQFAFGCGGFVFPGLVCVVALVFFVVGFTARDYITKVVRAVPTEARADIQKLVRAAPTDAAVFPSFPIPCRDDLATVAQQHFAKLGSAAEIGVFRGEFAAKNLKHWHGKYYMVDAWNWRPSDPVDKNFRSKATNDANFKATQEATSFASSRTEMIRSLSADAALRFADESLDWVYVDALHIKAGMLKDLEAWYPKVRPGGLISGDDYGDKDDTQLVSAKRWAAKYGGVAQDAENNWGVISAINEFTRARGIQVHITWMSDCYPFNAWYFVKPSV